MDELRAVLHSLGDGAVRIFLSAPTISSKLLRTDGAPEHYQGCWLLKILDDEVDRVVLSPRHVIAVTRTKVPSGDTVCDLVIHVSGAVEAPKPPRGSVYEKRGAIVL